MDQKDFMSLQVSQAAGVPDICQSVPGPSSELPGAVGRRDPASDRTLALQGLRQDDSVDPSLHVKPSAVSSTHRWPDLSGTMDRLTCLQQSRQSTLHVTQWWHASQGKEHAPSPPNCRDMTFPWEPTGSRWAPNKRDRRWRTGRGRDKGSSWGDSLGAEAEWTWRLYGTQSNVTLCVREKIPQGNRLCQCGVPASKGIPSDLYLLVPVLLDGPLLLREYGSSEPVSQAVPETHRFHLWHSLACPR